MRVLLLLTVFIGFFAACQQKPASPQDLNLEGFKIQDIPGSDIKRATLTDVKGKIIEEGTIQNGHKHGMWVLYYKDRDVPVSITNYVNGVPNGPQFEFGQYGHMEKMCSYTNNVLDGRFAKLKNIRKTEEGFYENGILEGNYKKYYDGRNDVQQELNYKHNKLDGDIIYYNEEGKATMKYLYKDGEKVSGGIVAPEKAAQ